MATFATRKGIPPLTIASMKGQTKELFSGIGFCETTVKGVVRLTKTNLPSLPNINVNIFKKQPKLAFRFVGPRSVMVLLRLIGPISTTDFKEVWAKGSLSVGRVHQGGKSGNEGNLRVHYMKLTQTMHYYIYK